MNLYTYSGQIAYPIGAPSLKDIAVSLAREGRYAGAGVHWWPVALHTFVVCDLLPPKLRLHGLLHDSPECITGDIPKPAKTEAMTAMEVELLESIYRGLGVRMPTAEEDQAVHLADRRALHGEVYTVGTAMLQTIYPKDERASELVEFYRKVFPVTECVDPEGTVVREFLYRFELYVEFDPSLKLEAK